KVRKSFSFYQTLLTKDRQTYQTALPKQHLIRLLSRLKRIKHFIENRYFHSPTALAYIYK
ncbi:hypothetical protein, partial [Porphyromonas canoris]|uniref:hypothetical protein n=1 Tax=Porphyromonas canoris TaxID=36875 RepID=UPI001F1CFB7F